MAYFGSSWDEEWYSNDKKMEKFNQYFMYGILVPLKAFKDWNLESDDDISCIFNTRDGEHMIIGRVLESTNGDNPVLGSKKPLIVPKLDEMDEIIIQNSVGKQYGIGGKFYYYFITQYE
jgi:hypothetical protein